MLADTGKTVAARSQGRQAAWSPLAHEAVRRIDRVFDAERALNGQAPEARLAARRLQVAPLVAELADWMQAVRARLSRHNDHPASKLDQFLPWNWQNAVATKADAA